jgi:hypothetical protein
MSAVDRRIQQLDTIAAVLPMERREELAELLTDVCAVHAPLVLQFRLPGKASCGPDVSSPDSI